MEIVVSAQSWSPVPGIPRKPLDNPWRPKPPRATDDEVAALLSVVLARVPRQLAANVRSPVPRLDALTAIDAALARQLILIAAAIHHTADERRTAEHLLRSHADETRGRRSALSLVRAARCAAEMDVRRVYRRETLTPREDLDSVAAERPVARTQDPSVGEVVLDKLRLATGHAPATARCREWILDAVVIALWLAERHTLNGGRGPSLIGMRADARKESRLVTHLRKEFDAEVAAPRIARLLVGSDGTPIETALLWWSAVPDLTSAEIPSLIRRRWIRDLQAADAAAAVAARQAPQARGGS